LRVAISYDNAPGQDKTWSDLYDEGLYALECGEFKEAMEHWSDMFECMPFERIDDVTKDLTAVITGHLCMRVDGRSRARLHRAVG